MKSLRHFLFRALTALCVVGAMAGCGDRDQAADRLYTPLYVYFNPLQLDMNVETLMSYFVNYPTDWEKMGLRGYPMMLSYEYSYPAWGITGASNYVFLPDGHLSEQQRTSFNVGSTGFDVMSFEYDDRSKLVRIKTVEDGRYKRRYCDEGFVYDAVGRLIRRERDQGGNPGTWNYLYDYHDNGALKSIQPERNNSLASESGVTLYKMEFDLLACMVRFVTPKTTNICLKDISEYKRGVSVTTYTYADNLCTKAIERVPVEFHWGVDTLTCTSDFTYNSHGDLAAWTYTGGVYQEEGNGWRVDDMTFTVKYEYVYDENGNWTQAKIIFPSNIDQIPALRTQYKAMKNGLVSNRDRSSSIKKGEALSLVVNRTIQYYDEQTVENGASSGEEADELPTEEGLLYKGTDTYGLSGQVKTVTKEQEALRFDRSGNLVYCKNSFGKETTYEYLTPTSYHVSGWGEAVVHIKTADGLRSDIDSDTNTELNQEYTFDSQKRLIKHVYCSQMAVVTCTYQYKGEDRHPSMMVEQHPEEGVTTYHYTYTHFDKCNNWTERKVSYTTEYDEYDDDMNYVGKNHTLPREYTEKRSIEYW